MADDQPLMRLGLRRRLEVAALVLGSQAPRSWTPQRLGRLQRYRPDPVALVASAAPFTLPDAELEARS